MTTRKIIRTNQPKVNPKNEEKEKKLAKALEGMQDMNKQLIEVNAGLKHNTNQMVEEIGRCLDNIFTRLAILEGHCGIVHQTETQTISELAEGTATSTDTMETPSSIELPAPSVEESLAQ
jgi:hypothetical protein